MDRGASFHLKPILRPAAARAHDAREWTSEHPEPGYLLPEEHRLGHWTVIGDPAAIEATHAAKMALASGRARATPGFSPLTEGVLNLDHPSGDRAADRQRYDQQVREYAAEVERHLGHRVIAAFVHLDEGRVEAGKPVYNTHAHLVIDRTDGRGRTVRFTPDKLKKLQDASARITGLRRGQPAAETGIEHLDAGQYRALARSGRLRDRDRAVKIEAVKEVQVEIVTRIEPGPPPPDPPAPAEPDERRVLDQYRKGVGRRVPANVDGVFGTKTVEVVINAGPLILEGIEIGKQLRDERLSRRVDDLTHKLAMNDHGHYWLGHAAGVASVEKAVVVAVGKAGWVPASDLASARSEAEAARKAAAEAEERHANLLKKRTQDAERRDAAGQAELTRLQQVEKCLAQERAEIAKAKAEAVRAGRQEAADIAEDARQEASRKLQEAERQARSTSAEVQARAAQRAAQTLQGAERAAAAKQALAEQYGALRGLLKVSGAATQADYQEAKSNKDNPTWLAQRIAALEAAAEAKAAAVAKQADRWRGAVETTVAELLQRDAAHQALWVTKRIYEHAGDAVPEALGRRHAQAVAAQTGGRSGGKSGGMEL